MAGALLLFVLAPRVILAARGGDPSAAPAPRLFDDVVPMALVSMLAVHVLAVLGVFDLVSLVAAYLAVAAVSSRVTPRKVRSAWRRAVARSLDLLERRISLGEGVAAVAGRARAAISASIPRGLALAWLLALAVVLGLSAWLRLADAVLHPATTLPDHPVRLAWLKALGSGRLYVDGVYPYGAEALLQVVRRFVAVDESLLVRLAPGILQCLVAAAVYWAVRRSGGGRGPALVGASLYGIFGAAGWLPHPRFPTGDVLGTDAALVFLLPALVFAAEAFADRARSRMLVLQAAACLVLVQPVVGGAALVAVVAGAVVAAGLGVPLRRAGATLASAVAGALVGSLPLVAGFLAEGRVPGGVLAPDRLFLGLAIRPSGLPAPEPLAPSSLVFVSVGAAVALVVLALGPRREQWGDHLERAALGAGLLAVVPLALPARFGLPEVIAPVEAGRALAPLACAVVALGLDRALTLVGVMADRRRVLEPVVTVAALAALAAAALPLHVRLGERDQPDGALRQLYRIKDRVPALTWTVVGNGRLLPEVAGRGFFVEQETFLDRYQPESWRFDPRRPDLAVPTRHVFILVRTRPVKAPAASSGDAAVQLPPPSAVADVSARPRLVSWLDRYRATHRNLTTWAAGEGVTVYHIRRSAQEERDARRVASAARSGR